MKKIVLVFAFLLTISFQVNAQWFWQNPVPTGNELNSIAFYNDIVGWTGGGYGTILKTIDGGSNWITQEIGNDLWVSDIFIISQDIVWVATFTGPVLYTTNGGENWINF